MELAFGVLAIGGLLVFARANVAAMLTPPVVPIIGLSSVAAQNTCYGDYLNRSIKTHDGASLAWSRVDVSVPTQARWYKSNVATVGAPKNVTPTPRPAPITTQGSPTLPK
jgi:hypothetical protein